MLIKPKSIAIIGLSAVLATSSFFAVRAIWNSAPGGQRIHRLAFEDVSDAHHLEQAAEATGDDWIQSVQAVRDAIAAEHGPALADAAADVLLAWADPDPTTIHDVLVEQGVTFSNSNVVDNTWRTRHSHARSQFVSGSLNPADVRVFNGSASDADYRPWTGTSGPLRVTRDDGRPFLASPTSYGTREVIIDSSLVSVNGEPFSARIGLTFAFNPTTKSWALVNFAMGGQPASVLVLPPIL